MTVMVKGIDTQLQSGYWRKIAQLYLGCLEAVKDFGHKIALLVQQEERASLSVRQLTGFRHDLPQQIRYVSCNHISYITI